MVQPVVELLLANHVVVPDNVTGIRRMTSHDRDTAATGPTGRKRIEVVVMIAIAPLCGRLVKMKQDVPF